MSNFDLKENFFINKKQGYVREGCILVLLAWKGVRKVANILLQIFAYFLYTIFKQFCNIMATQNKN